MTRNAAIFLPKGGVGKTWLSAHLSAGLALVGRRVLVVDVDATQCQLALAFDGIHRRGDTARLFRETRTPVSSLVQTVGAFPGLDIITAEPESSRALPDFLRNSGPFWITTLAERLATVNDYDYILFDCGPGLDEVTQCVIHACNEIWMPYRVDYKSWDSYLLLRDEILPRLRRDDGMIKHVIPNMLSLGRRRDASNERTDERYELVSRARTNDAAAILAELRREVGDLMTAPIRMAEAASLRADGTGQLIWQFAPNSPVADDLARVIETIVAAEVPSNVAAL